jgi:methyl-accepting chemotaxis protein
MGADMSAGILARLSGTSVAARVFAAPVMGVLLTVAALVLADREAEQAVTAIDAIHQSAGERRGQIERLVGTAFAIHSDVSRHLALSGSGIEDARLKAMRDAITANVGTARKALSALRDLPLTAAERDMLGDVAKRLDAYVKAVDQMNEMAAIDRLIAIPLMAHVDEQFKGLTDRLAAARDAIGN